MDQELDTIFEKICAGSSPRLIVSPENINIQVQTA